MKKINQEKKNEEKGTSLINNILQFNSIKCGNFIFESYINNSIQSYYHNQKNAANNKKFIPVNLFEYFLYKIIKRKIETNSVNNDIIIISNYYLSSYLIKEDSKALKYKKIILFPSQNRKTKKWNLFIFFRSVVDMKNYARIISSNDSYLEDNKMLENIASKLQNTTQFFYKNKNEKLQLNIECIQINKNDLINTSELILNFIEYLSDIQNIKKDFCNQLLSLFAKNNTKNFIELFRKNNHIIDEAVKKSKKIKKIFYNKINYNSKKRNSISIEKSDYNLNTKTSFNLNYNTEESVLHYQKDNVPIDKKCNNTVVLDVKVISCKNFNDVNHKITNKNTLIRGEKPTLTMNNNEKKEKIEPVKAGINGFIINNNSQIKQIYKELSLTKNEIQNKIKKKNLNKSLNSINKAQLKHAKQSQQKCIQNFVRKSKTFLKQYYINNNKNKTIIRYVSSKQFTFGKSKKKYIIDDDTEDNFFESSGIKKLKIVYSNPTNNKINYDKIINPIKYSKIEFKELSEIIEKSQYIKSEQKKRSIRTSEKVKNESDNKYLIFIKNRTKRKTKLHFPPKLDNDIILGDLEKNLNDTETSLKKLENSFLVFNLSMTNSRSFNSLKSADKKFCSIM